MTIATETDAIATTDYGRVRAKVASLIDSVPDAGMIHTRQRWGEQWQQFLNLFAATLSNGSQQIRGWTITRTGIQYQEDDSRFGPQGNSRIHSMLVQGFMAFQDQSDTDGQFQALVDSVVQALDGDPSVSTSEMSTLVANSPGVPKAMIDIRRFGSVVCHYCEIEFTYQSEGP